jgi:hypothetical protein
MREDNLLVVRQDRSRRSRCAAGSIVRANEVVRREM